MFTQNDPDYITSLGPAFTAHRFQRMADRFADAIQAYLQKVGFTAPARAVSTLLLLHEWPGLSVTQIAAQIKLSHPLIINLLAQLETHGLIHFTGDAKDRRRRLIFLTKAGEAQVSLFQKAQPIIRAAYAELAQETQIDLWQMMQTVDKALMGKPFLQRLEALDDMRALLDDNKT